MKKILLTSFLLAIVGGAPNYVLSAEDTRALVKTQPLVKQVLTETVSGYGSASIDPLSTVNINFPRAGRIARVLVSQGETVKKETPLLELETAPQESVAFERARSAVDLARSELAGEQSLLANQLATRSQVATAQKTLLDAEAALAAQEKLGTGTPREIIRAPYEGLVNAVQVAPGDRILAGATALQLSRLDRLRVILGVEPEDARRVKPGMQVRLVPVFEPDRSLPGEVLTVSGMIDPQTGLVDVIVVPKPKQALRLMPGIRVQGIITLSLHREFTVPRQAVLSDGQGTYIFIVKNHHAYRVNVQTDLENRGLIGITGRFEQQNRVVVLGNYELREGMGVREASP